MTQFPITRAAVIGAGTMGAAIAALLANAGYPVVLLDAVPDKLTPDEEKRGLTLKHPAVRNRLVKAGLERCVKASPANFALPEFADRITTGNTEDDLGKLADADWIIEAIYENLGAKQALMAKIEGVRKPSSIVSSNTSGLPIGQIAEGRSGDFKRRFLGTHFFNPPRYVRLLEIIPTAETDPEVVATIRAFATRVLGRGVVMCKDTPNFIGNRIGSLSGAFTANYIQEGNYGVEEVDAITGPLVGNPKTATFRLMDLVGLDVAAAVGGNLYDLIPNDESREVLRNTGSRAMRQEMVKRGWLGNKAGQGFYKEMKGKDGKREFWALDTATMEYKPPQKVRFESVEKAKDVEPLGARLKLLLNSDDRAGKFLWDTMSFGMAYASRRVPEIADEFYQIDNAMKWGYNRQMGPFEIWDALGVAETAKRMEAEGKVIAPWVKEMLANGCASFYQYENGQAVGYYDLTAKKHLPLPSDPSVVTLAALRAQGKELKRNDSASLLDMGDGVLCLEFHTRTLNAIDLNMMELLSEALDELNKPQYAGMVIGNEGEAFSAGANLFGMASGSQQGDADGAGGAVKRFQDLLMRVRYSPKPVVAATSGMALGGGAEVAMACARIVAHLETYMGLVETGMGLVPGGGGVKELLRRNSVPMKTASGVNPQPFVGKVFQNVAQAKVSTSAYEALQMGFLTESDRVVFGRDRLLGEAKREVLKLVADDYRPPIRGKSVYATGRDGLASLKVQIFAMRGGNYASEHDTVVGRHLANIVAGGDLSSAQWVSEQYILDLEREAFVALLQEPKTMERIWSFLQTGRPVRN